MKVLSIILFVVAVIAIISFNLIAAAAGAAAGGIDYHYDPTTAMQSLEYAKIAYCPSSNIRSWSCAACPLHPSFKVFQVYDNQSLDSQAYSGYDPATDRIVVAFRGSYNIKNWISDLTFVKVPYPLCSGCEVHKGFYEEWLSYATPILNDVAKLSSMHPSSSIFVSGHSLGAATAVHCATELAYRYGAARVSEYSFGTPRVGNPAFSMFVTNITKSKTQRITHKRDPVPHLPLEAMGFLHSTHESWYDNDGDTQWKNCNDWPGHEDNECSDSVLAVDVEDHLHYLGRSTECNMN